MTERSDQELSLREHEILGANGSGLQTRICAQPLPQAIRATGVSRGGFSLELVSVRSQTKAISKCAQEVIFADSDDPSQFSQGNVAKEMVVEKSRFMKRRGNHGRPPDVFHELASASKRAIAFTKRLSISSVDHRVCSLTPSPRVFLRRPLDAEQRSLAPRDVNSMNI